MEREADCQKMYIDTDRY